MGRPKGGTNRKYSFEFKLQAMKDYFDSHLSRSEITKKYEISNGTFDVWKKNYLDGCLEEGRPHNRGNRFAALYSSNHLTNEQRLELENMKLRIENERLKKGYLVKGGGADKEYVSILDRNTKSSEK